MWRAHDGMGWWMVFGGALWLIFWITVIYLVVSLVSGAREPREPRQPRGDADPLEIAKRRYAAGEITREQFQQIHDDLVSGQRPGG